MAVSQANLFASQSHPVKAEPTCRIARRPSPANPEPIAHLAGLYEQNSRATEATQLLQNYARLYPDQRETVEQLRGWKKGRQEERRNTQNLSIMRVERGKSEQSGGFVFDSVAGHAKAAETAAVQDAPRLPSRSRVRQVLDYASPLAF